MKKILFLLFLLVFSSFNTYAEDENDKIPEISKIQYSGYLDSDTDIKIYGYYLDSCNYISFNNKKINSDIESSKIISFDFSEINEYSGTIDISCGEYDYSYNYEFPHLETVTYYNEDEDRKISITGSDLDNSKIYIEDGGIVTQSVSGSSRIVGTLPQSELGEKIYASKDGLKSNLLEIDISIPKINFIYSESGFLTGEDIEIHGENLSYYNSTDLILQDEEYNDIDIEDFEVNSDGTIITFVPDNIYGDYYISVSSNGFISNSELIHIFGEVTVVNNAFEKYVAGEGRKLFVYVDGLNKKDSGLEIYLNTDLVEYEYFDASDGIIALNDYELEQGNNIITVFGNGSYSNSFNYLNENDSLPVIYAVEIGDLDLEEGKRSFKLMLHNYDSSDENIYLYLNDTEIFPVGCTSSYCRVEIDESILKGDFKVGYDNYISNEFQSFDLTEKYRPYISQINIDGNNVEILGENLYGTSIDTGNFMEDVLDSNIGYSKVTGRLIDDIKTESNSYISVRKYNEITESSFNIDKDGYNIEGAPYVDKYSSDDYLFAIGSKVTVNGVNLYENTKVVIGNVKTSLNFNDNTFIIPGGVELGKNNIYLETEDGTKSNTDNIFIFNNSKSLNNNIGLNESEKTYFYINEDQENENNLYSFNLENYLDDLSVFSISFNVEGIDNYGIFTLYIDNRIVGYGVVDDNGVLKFDLDYDFSYNDEYEIDLYKYSPFVENGDFTISVSDIEGIYKNYDTLTPSFNYPSEKTKFTISNSDESLCVDSEDDNYFCNSFLQGTSYDKEEDTVTEDQEEIIQDNQEDESEENIDKYIDYSFEIQTNRLSSVKNLILSRQELNKTETGSKYVSQFEGFIENQSDNNSYKTLGKVYSVQDKLENINSSKYDTVKTILTFIQSKLEIKLNN